MKRILLVLLVISTISLVARPANPLSVGADLTLGFYQRLISPLQGGHICNFSPTCSNFSRQSFSLYGPFWGTLMTFDRLERCNPGAWRLVDLYYSGVENERIADPPRNHHLPSRLRSSKGKTDTASVNTLVEDVSE
ncbi:membrane protein insertion efficiency factor YidD [candidate division WOR-3 bacterium]|uniref:Membrane protein insertion efficiency factor YidD n=1 Tax=candidate division WOR-3 bacterium TaxID=2052148 RepID=A0A9D5KC45_UNCW3|nr:membrane protein insertion efficiency factor YidD [candidate division WOR-3 bacterium]MBD3365001.1 membrane protein insertion efficiency factor YidD [candidate division WOR-3 bacterium]